MSLRAAVFLGAIVGSIVGGYVPALFGASLLSGWSIFGSMIGGLLGIFMAIKLSRFST